MITILSRKKAGGKMPTTEPAPYTLYEFVFKNPNTLCQFATFYTLMLILLLTFLLL
jgi:hypothetical protein